FGLWVWCLIRRRRIEIGKGAEVGRRVDVGKCLVSACGQIVAGNQSRWVTVDQGVEALILSQPRHLGSQWPRNEDGMAAAAGDCGNEDVAREVGSVVDEPIDNL